MHGMGFCCCPAGCDYFTDAFTTDGTPTGWTQTAGTWTNSGGFLTVSSADAIIECDTTHPSSSTKYRVSVLMEGGEEGDQIRAWINDDPTTFGEITFHTNGATGRARLRLFVAGTLVGETDIYAPPGSAGASYLYLCTDGDHVALGVGGALYLSAPVTITSSICGLATGILDGGTPAKFDNFKLTKDQSDDATCPACGESCVWFSEVGYGNVENVPDLNPADYEIVSGSWDSLTTSSASALMLVDFICPDGNEYLFRVGCGNALVGSPNPDILVVADYVNNQNYLYLRFRAYSESPGPRPFTAEFHEVVAGNDELRASWSWPEGGFSPGTQFYVELAIWLRSGKACAYIARLSYVAGYYNGTLSQIHIGTILRSPNGGRGGFGTGSQNSYSLAFGWIWGVRDSCALFGQWTVGGCEGGATCSHCSATPTAFDVTLASVASEATCNFTDPGGCVLWNDVFRCVQDPADPCRYVYTAGGSPGACSPHHVVVTILEIGSFIHAIDVEGFADAAETKRIWFRKSYTTAPIACASLSGESIAFQAQTVCAGTPTCSVTAIP